MSNPIPRLLLAIAAAFLAFGGAVHALAFRKAAAAVAASNLATFYGNALKGLWLIDSATLVTLAAAFALIAVRPAMASGGVIALLALIPAATAAFLYYFIGAFAPAHLLLAAAALAFSAGLLLANA